MLGRAAVSNSNYIRANLDSTVLKRIFALDKRMHVGSEGIRFHQGEHPADGVTASLVGWGHPPSGVSDLSLELISTGLELAWSET